MSIIPNPLHPAVVHFPIVLIVLGAAVSILAVFWRRGYVPTFAATLLALGALGAWAAIETGESDGGLIENAAAQVAPLLDAHEDWAKRTLTAAIFKFMGYMISQYLSAFENKYQFFRIMILGLCDQWQ